MIDPDIRMYVGITDEAMYEEWKRSATDEVVFWTPGLKNFHPIREGDLYLLKLHAPKHYIVGGGYFVRYSVLPVYQVWEMFGTRTGLASLQAFTEKLRRYRARHAIDPERTEIGCIILRNPFYLREENYIPAPENWSNQIVTGKLYDRTTPEGSLLWKTLREKLEKEEKLSGLTAGSLGPGAFRALVTDAYHRRCAITGEQVLPALSAAEIRPFTEGGEYRVSNGILLRADLKALFEAGYLTLDKDYHVRISTCLAADYGEGNPYRELEGKEVGNLPEQLLDLPDPQALSWHREHVFLQKD